MSTAASIRSKPADDFQVFTRLTSSDGHKLTLIAQQEHRSVAAQARKVLSDWLASQKVPS
jgi:hypothetical protein